MVCLQSTRFLALSLVAFGISGPGPTCLGENFLAWCLWECLRIDSWDVTELKGAAVFCAYLLLVCVYGTISPHICFYYNIPPGGEVVGEETQSADPPVVTGDD